MPETSGKRRGKAAKSSRTADERSPEGERDAAPTPVCTVAFCPICMTVTAAQGAAPDALEHLLNAARELFLAARAVVDVRADDLDGRGQTPPRSLERIEIA